MKPLAIWIAKGFYYLPIPVPLLRCRFRSRNDNVQKVSHIEKMTYLAKSGSELIKCQIVCERVF